MMLLALCVGLAVLIAGAMRRPTLAGQRIRWLGLVLGGLILADAAGPRDPPGGSPEEMIRAVLGLLAVLTAAILAATRHPPKGVA